jgi:hypothetical protein
MSDWCPPGVDQSRRFNLARPRWWAELFALVLVAFEVAILFWADFEPIYVLIAVPFGIAIFVGGYLVWRPLNYLIVKPDRIVIKTWAFSGGSEEKREVPFEGIEDMGADNAAGILWLRYAPTYDWEEDTREPGRVITLHISPAREAKAAAEAIEDGRRRIRPFLDELDARIRAAETVGGQARSQPGADEEPG